MKHALTVHAMCNPGGSLSALRCQPFLDMISPTSRTLSSEGGRRDTNATTEAGGEPRMHSSGISDLIVRSIVFAQETIERQDSR